MRGLIVCVDENSDDFEIDGFACIDFILLLRRFVFVVGINDRLEEEGAKLVVFEISVRLSRNINMSEVERLI